MSLLRKDRYRESDRPRPDLAEQAFRVHLCCDAHPGNSSYQSGHQAEAHPDIDFLEFRDGRGRKIGGCWRASKSDSRSTTGRPQERGERAPTNPPPESTGRQRSPMLSGPDAHKVTNSRGYPDRTSGAWQAAVRRRLACPRWAVGGGGCCGAQTWAAVASAASRREGSGSDASGPAVRRFRPLPPLVDRSVMR
jgi:hypothetical protein